jgi:hypothetical protein
MTAPSDYHINSTSGALNHLVLRISSLRPTSEFFYQLKGSMNLKLVRDNKFEDHWINEGEMFLCPGPRHLALPSVRAS